MYMYAYCHAAIYSHQYVKDVWGWDWGWWGCQRDCFFPPLRVQLPNDDMGSSLNWGPFFRPPI